MTSSPRSQRSRNSAEPVTMTPTPSGFTRGKVELCRRLTESPARAVAGCRATAAEAAARALLERNRRRFPGPSTASTYPGASGWAARITRGPRVQASAIARSIKYSRGLSAVQPEAIRMLYLRPGRNGRLGPEPALPVRDGPTCLSMTVSPRTYKLPGALVLEIGRGFRVPSQSRAPDRSRRPRDG